MSALEELRKIFDARITEMIKSNSDLSGINMLEWADTQATELLSKEKQDSIEFAIKEKKDFGIWLVRNYAPTVKCKWREIGTNRESTTKELVELFNNRNKEK